VIALNAREAKGQGSAMATIRNRLESVDGGTRVTAETDRALTGPEAQVGRGVIEDGGRRILGEFSQRLEERIAESATAEPQSPAPVPASELDVGSLVASTPAARIGAAALVLVLVLFLLRRRR